MAANFSLDASNAFVSSIELLNEIAEGEQVL
jgi:hypothetical protein